MNLLWGRVGQDGQGIEQLVSASDQALGAIASQSPDVQRTVGLLGPTLRTTRVALAKTDQLATVLGPAINSLRPFARKLKPVNDSLGQPGQEHLSIPSSRRSARSSSTPASRCATCGRRRENLVDATPRLTTVG